MDHEAKFIGPRQDTYLPAEHIQMPDIWGEKRLHVVESRDREIKKAIERFRRMQEIYESVRSDRSTEVKRK